VARIELATRQESAAFRHKSGIIASIMKAKAHFSATLAGFFVSCLLFSGLLAQSSGPASTPAVVLHAARLLEIESGKIIMPGEVLVEGERIAEVGSSVKRPAGAEVIDLGDRTLLPGLIDAHVHLFLHPGAEDLQTIQESVRSARFPWFSRQGTTFFSRG